MASADPEQPAPAGRAPFSPAFSVGLADGAELDDARLELQSTVRRRPPNRQRSAQSPGGAAIRSWSLRSGPFRVASPPAVRQVLAPRDVAGSPLLPDLERAKGARCVVVGSITGNSNTIGGGFVYPRAEIGELKGLKKGGGRSSEMVDGGKFDGAKAYKDAKALNMMTVTGAIRRAIRRAMLAQFCAIILNPHPPPRVQVTELHRRYHDKTGVVFSSMYPGCIAETGLFREKRQWFRDVFPLFMKYVTGGYVSEQEAGERLAQVIWDERCSKSGERRRAIRRNSAQLFRAIRRDSAHFV